MHSCTCILGANLIMATNTNILETIDASSPLGLPTLFENKLVAVLVEDIHVYIFTFSAVNALAHKNHSSRLKQQPDLDSTHASDTQKVPDIQDSHDQQSLVELCIKLQEKISVLETSVKLQKYWCT